MLARVLSVSRRVTRWLSLLLGLACPGDATRQAGDERRRGWTERNRGPGGDAVLYPPPAVTLASSFEKSQVPGAPEAAWELPGRHRAVSVSA